MMDLFDDALARAVLPHSPSSVVQCAARGRCGYYRSASIYYGVSGSSSIFIRRELNVHLVGRSEEGQGTGATHSRCGARADE